MISCKRMTTVSFIIFFVLCPSFFLSMVFAQKPKSEVKPKITAAIKVVSGQVNSIYKMGISVVYNKDLEKGSEQEMFFRLDEKVQLRNKKTFNQINPGDTVSVEYDELIQENRGVKNIQRVARVVTFLKPAPITPDSLKTEEKQDADNSSGQASLILKGEKSER